MSALDKALNIVAHYGVPVFPLNSKKGPVCADGFYAAGKDEAKIREMFADPNAVLVGVPTGEVSGFDVLDPDT